MPPALVAARVAIAVVSALSPKSFWLHLSNGSNALKYAKARKMFIISAVQTRDEANDMQLSRQLQKKGSTERKSGVSRTIRKILLGNSILIK